MAGNEKLNKTLNAIEKNGGQVLQSFDDGIPMDKPCPNCKADSWDMNYHSPNQAGFGCNKCGTEMCCSLEGTMFFHAGKVIRNEDLDGNVI